jgi:hypothetical protein
MQASAISLPATSYSCASALYNVPEYLAHLERGAAHATQRGNNALGVGLVEQEAALEAGTAIRDTRLRE